MKYGPVLSEIFGYTLGYADLSRLVLKGAVFALVISGVSGLIFITFAKDVAKILSTRNAWQSLAYSPLGAVVSPPSKYLWKTLTY